MRELDIQEEMDRIVDQLDIEIRETFRETFSSNELSESCKSSSLDNRVLMAFFTVDP